MLLLGLAAAMALSGPDAAPGAGAEQTYTSAEEMSCAAWAAYSAGSADDDQAAEGFGYAMNYFLGRYEVLAGTGDFAGALDAALAQLTASQESFDKIQDECLPRWQTYLDRLDSWQGRNSANTSEAPKVS